MAARFDPADPGPLDPDQRFEQICAALALGARRVLALRSAAHVTPTLPPPESEQNPLDVSPPKSVHVPVRLTQAENAEGVEA